MSPVHPLKRKSVKPSSSTVRGMLPPAQYKVLDAALQSLRSTGLRFDWKWKNKSVGWVCAGDYDDITFCEIWVSDEPILGVSELDKPFVHLAMNSDKIPKKFRNVLKFPVEETDMTNTYEFSLESTAERDLFSEFVESLLRIV